MKTQIYPKYYYRNFLHPKYWLTWLGISLMFLISLLPYSGKIWLGRQLGLLMLKLGGSRLQITQANIRACFPELSDTQQQQLIKDTFIANMTGMVETTTAWWGNHQPVLNNLTVYGREHLAEAEARGKGVLLVGGHFSILDLAGPMANHTFDFNYMYRPNDNPLFDALIERSRVAYSHNKFSKYELKEMMEFIRQGNTVWYGYDQDFGGKRSVFAPFFGIQTATLKAPMAIARETGATVVMISQFAEGNGKYAIHVSPILENFQDDDDVTAATRLNAQLEQFVRLHPEQYLWLHRRFRSRPEGEEPFYPKKKRKPKK
ncbi:LpxL/LpxP family acyltransferase [Bacterioplanoides pacificum]|uniref:Lipid A biosynthesis acyltransferase n=1 Tax=Bacterioplanoides pacificum TaxID=1171596 RepID=A0ABV7VX40_9GAMM